MNRRIGWVLIIFGIVLAFGTGGLVFMLLRQQESRALEQARAQAIAEIGPEVATMQLPVAARPIAPGAVLTSQDLLLKEFPLDLVPVSAITNTVLLENQVVVQPIGQGETFSQRQIAGDPAGPVSQRIPAGKVVFAFPISDLLTESDIIVDGDRVDLLLTIPVGLSADGITEVATGYAIQNIEVFKVLRPASEEDQSVGAPTALLLLVAPEEALLIKHTKDSGGVIDLTLRSVVDREPFEAPAIERADLLANFQPR